MESQLDEAGHMVVVHDLNEFDSLGGPLHLFTSTRIEVGTTRTTEKTERNLWKIMKIR